MPTYAFKCDIRNHPGSNFCNIWEFQESFVNRANWAPTFMPLKKALGMLFQGLIFRRICFTNSTNVFLPFSHNICFIPVSGCLKAILTMTGDIILLSGPFPLLLPETYFPSGYHRIPHIENISELFWGIETQIMKYLLKPSLLASKIIVRWSNHLLETFTTISLLCSHIEVN